VRRVERLAPGERLLLASLLERLLESEPDEDAAPNEAPAQRSARQPLTAEVAR
jgi:hypothetical protein